MIKAESQSAEKQLPSNVTVTKEYAELKIEQLTDHGGEGEESHASSENESHESDSNR
jgi:hypothetical protein